MERFACERLAWRGALRCLAGGRVTFSSPSAKRKRGSMPGGGKRAGVDDLRSLSRTQPLENTRRTPIPSNRVSFVLSRFRSGRVRRVFLPLSRDSTRGRVGSLAWPVIGPGLFCRLASRHVPLLAARVISGGIRRVDLAGFGIETITLIRSFAMDYRNLT